MIVSIANCLSPASDRLISVTRNRVKCNERLDSPAVSLTMTGSRTVFEDGVRTTRRFIVEVSASVISISRCAVVSQCPTFAGQISGLGEWEANERFREDGFRRLRSVSLSHEACPMHSRSINRRRAKFGLNYRAPPAPGSGQA
jgi:hypothetical protein